MQPECVGALLEQLGNRRLLGHSLHWQSLYLSRYGDYAEALAARLRSRALMAANPILSDAAWQEYAQVLLLTNESIFID